MQVLVTRPDGEATREALERRGHVVLLDPLLHIRPCAAALPDGPFDAVIATSANAFLADTAILSALAGLPLAVVGQRTAASAQRRGLGGPEIIAADVADLAATLRRRWPTSRRLLHLAGEDRAVDLPALLGTDYQVETLVVYRAVLADRLGPAAEQALRAGTLDAVLHYSARTASVFLAACRLLSLDGVGPRHICLSARVAGPLRTWVGADVRVAVRPDEEGIFRALEG